jgi:hypothetical protein
MGGVEFLAKSSAGAAKIGCVTSKTRGPREQIQSLPGASGIGTRLFEGPVSLKSGAYCGCQAPKNQRRNNAIMPASSIGTTHKRTSTIATHTTIRHNIERAAFLQKNPGAYNCKNRAAKKNRRSTEFLLAGRAPADPLAKSLCLFKNGPPRQVKCITFFRKVSGHFLGFPNVKNFTMPICKLLIRNQL